MKTKGSYQTPSQWAVTAGLTKYALRASFRNRAGYFFSLIFPIVFVLVFGLIGESNQAIKLGVTEKVNKENPLYQTIKQIADKESAPVELVDGLQADLEKQLSQDKLDSILAPADQAPNQLTLITSNGSPQGKAAAEAFLQGITSQMNLQAARLTNLPFSFQTQEISGRTFRYIDFALPGQIGFSMLSLATFGVAFTFITLRKTLVLKRMFATTVKPFDFVVAQALSRSVQAIFQTGVIILLGVAAFHFSLARGWLSVVELMVLSFLGILAFLGFGILIANLAKDEQTLPIVLNLFNLPQILLAGVFFPIDGMPHWVQLIGNNLPLAYLNIAMRKVSIEGLSFFDVWPYILGLIGWALLSYILAAKTFKTE